MSEIEKELLTVLKRHNETFPDSQIKCDIGGKDWECAIKGINEGELTLYEAAEFLQLCSPHQWRIYKPDNDYYTMFMKKGVKE